jgi:uncharacterized protein (TIGR02246 family)
MIQTYAIGFAVGLSLLLAGCSDSPKPVPDTRAADEKAIRDGEIAWNAEFKAKDIDKIVDHYADAATVMAPGEPAARGKDAIRTLLTGMLADNNLALSFTATSVEVAKAGDIAYSQGIYASTTTNPKTKRPVNEKGAYVTVYKKQTGGVWKAVEDINTPDSPAIPTAAPKKSTAKAARRKR